jgi:hypothetical protein
VAQGNKKKWLFKLLIGYAFAIYRRCVQGFPGQRTQFDYGKTIVLRVAAIKEHKTGKKLQFQIRNDQNHTNKKTVVFLIIKVNC